MKFMRFALVMGMVCAATSAVGAQVTPIGEFVGDATETFENIGPPGTFSGAIFGGDALMQDVLAGNPVITFNLSDGVNNLFAYDGTFMGLSPTGWTSFTFDTPVVKFGGFFAHLTSSNPTSSISFFDETGGLIEAQTLSVVYNEWNWFGWESDTPIGSIVINIAETPGATGVYDNLQITYVPAPGALALLAVGACVSRRRRRR
jgi:hypothetical protein